MRSLNILLSILVLFVFMQCADESKPDQDNDQVEISAQEEKINSELTFSEELNTNNPLLNSEEYKRIAQLLPTNIGTVKAGPFEGWIPSVEQSVKYTYAKRSYRDAVKKSRIDIGISDTGDHSLTELGLVRYWFGKNIDRQPDEQTYEKAKKIKNYPAFERCEKKVCDVYIAIDDRYLITGHSQNLPVEQLIEILEKLDLEKLKK